MGNERLIVKNLANGLARLCLKMKPKVFPETLQVLFCAFSVGLITIYYKKLTLTWTLYCFGMAFAIW